jgi:hypothetical protein
VLQVKSQEKPSQLATPFVGAAQGEQLVPHELSEVFERHWPLHAWYPELQVNVHVFPVQVGVAFVGVAQGEQTF